ncbi:hypothetical protein PV646_28540 [Streptomyces sp. ID05-26A]|nr:hypothetical protein [Streptomyces sp. ID05-26A]
MTDSLEVREIRVNTDTREIALCAPNGRAVDPTPWLVIATQEPLEPGFHWMTERDVFEPGWQPLDWLGLTLPSRLGELLFQATDGTRQ